MLNVQNMCNMGYIKKKLVFGRRRQKITLKCQFAQKNSKASRTNVVIRIKFRGSFSGHKSQFNTFKKFHLTPLHLFQGCPDVRVDL